MELKSGHQEEVGEVEEGEEVELESGRQEEVGEVEEVKLKSDHLHLEEVGEAEEVELKFDCYLHHKWVGLELEQSRY